MEEFIKMICGGALIGVGFGLAFVLWAIPSLIANKRCLDQVTRGGIWAMMIIGIFCPLFWLIALAVSIWCDKK